MPFAVDGRWRATVIPAKATCRPCRAIAELLARERPCGEVRAKERERVRLDRHARVAVVGEHALPAREVAEGRRLGRRLELERELLQLAVGSRHRLRAEDEPELPEEVATRLPEAVAGAALDERLEAVVREARPAGEVGDVAERPVPLPLGDERLGVVLPDRGDVVQADADGREPG